MTYIYYYAKCFNHIILCSPHTNPVYRSSLFTGREMALAAHKIVLWLHASRRDSKLIDYGWKFFLRKYAFAFIINIQMRFEDDDIPSQIPE